MRTRCYDGKKWQYEFKYEGKRYRKKGFRTKREANSAGLDKLNELRHGYNFDSSLTLKDYFRNWCETYKEPVVTPTTYRHYKFTLQHLENHKIGSMKLTELNRQVYQKFINDFSDSHAKETIRKTNGAIRSSLNDAIYDGLISKNPTYKVNYKAGKETKKESEKYVTINEYETLKEHFKNSNSRAGLALYIMICTGCRISGVKYMKVQYIDQIKNQIYIDEHKTDSSPRYVTVAKKDMQHIVSAIDDMIISYDGYIFKNGGIILTSNAINKALKKTCIKLGITPITSHAIRHTHCSYLLAKGISIYYISKRLGHKNISITTSIYSHLLEEKFIEEDNKAVEALSEM
ncbi:tyrosine-type recombinase/integrase [Staphylococcus pettenkoferi]|uniref:Site-specific integrase n=1 Tax=Staphylococcus pettenkoferi TaxID=170573 RepID=A0A9Q4H132_9STAP|nr:site-specific integrase [Staphylococcus pettenkoferi]MCY1595419.1 site-specific integrase [Staphylococcus pettenkoferi]